MLFQSPYNRQQVYKVYEMASSMPTPFPKATAHRLIQILGKPEQLRDSEQRHFLWLALRKQVASLSETSQWAVNSRYLQSLQVRTGDSMPKQQPYWLITLSGSFTYFDMVYRNGESFVVPEQESQHLGFRADSYYVILSRKARNQILAELQQRRQNYYRHFIRKVLFAGNQIENKEYHLFWERGKFYDVAKGAGFDLRDKTDMILIVLQGSMLAIHPWKRPLRLRELRDGSLFSSYLGRYFYKTGEQLKNADNLTFSYVGKQKSVVFGFDADIFYEEDRLSKYKFVIDMAWQVYLERCAQAKRIIEEVGSWKLDKKEVIKNMQEQIAQKFLKERSISVPVAIEKRKIRNIISGFLDDRSNRRKLPNKAKTFSVQNLKKQVNYSINPQASEAQNKALNDLRLSIVNNTTSLTKITPEMMFFRSQTERVRTSSPSSAGKKRPNTSRSRTEGIDLKELKQTAAEGEDNNHFYQFFRPEEFVSKKLKNHYEYIIECKKKIQVSPHRELNPIESQKDYLSRKQKFEQYLNSRRIIKLGPKKKLLYHKKVHI